LLSLVFYYISFVLSKFLLGISSTYAKFFSLCSFYIFSTLCLFLLFSILIYLVLCLRDKTLVNPLPSFVVTIPFFGTSIFSTSLALSLSGYSSFYNFYFSRTSFNTYFYYICVILLFYLFFFIFCSVKFIFFTFPKKELRLGPIFFISVLSSFLFIIGCLDPISVETLSPFLKRAYFLVTFPSFLIFYLVFPLLDNIVFMLPIEGGKVSVFSPLRKLSGFASPKGPNVPSGVEDLVIARGATTSKAVSSRTDSNEVVNKKACQRRYYQNKKNLKMARLEEELKNKTLTFNNLILSRCSFNRITCKYYSPSIEVNSLIQNIYYLDFDIKHVNSPSSSIFTLYSSVVPSHPFREYSKVIKPLTSCNLTIEQSLFFIKAIQFKGFYDRNNNFVNHNLFEGLSSEEIASYSQLFQDYLTVTKSQILVCPSSLYYYNLLGEDNFYL
jgi:hypothetical protein